MEHTIEIQKHTTTSLDTAGAFYNVGVVAYEMFEVKRYAHVSFLNDTPFLYVLLHVKHILEV
jgi:hypothetical protein